MSFIFGLLHAILTSIILFDTLGIIYQFRKSFVRENEFKRVWVSWLLFLSISSIPPCSKKGFIGTLVRLIILSAKAYVTIPILGGSLKIYKYLIEDKKAVQYYDYSFEIIKSSLLKKKFNNTPSNGTDNVIQETLEPENVPPTSSTLEECK